MSVEDIFNKDPYLNDQVAVRRLIKEWEEGPIVICYTVDGVVVKDNDGKFTFPSVIDLLRHAEALKALCIPVTTNVDMEYQEMVYDFLEKNKIPYTRHRSMDINLNDYNLLLDDRAGLSAAYSILYYAVEHMEKKRDGIV